MREHKSTLRSLEASGASGARLKKNVADCNKCISDCYNSLEDALTDLDRSTLIKGGDWSECTSSAWDDFYTAINATYVREKDLADTKVAIKRSVLKLETLIGAVQERMDQELRRHKA
jgi:SMC interacting uncharacterized protein involved in chromosome segregation